jgi:hypothetical protein
VVQRRREQRRGMAARAAVVQRWLWRGCGVVAAARLLDCGGGATMGGVVDKTAQEDNGTATAREDNGMVAAREDNGGVVEDE